MAMMAMGVIFSGVTMGIRIKEQVEVDEVKEELIQRDEARKKLERARDEWNKSTALYIHKMQTLRQELSDANVSVETTNKALDELRGAPGREPRLEDFYTPSPEMERYMFIVCSVLGVGVGWIGYKVYKYMSQIKRWQA